MISNKTMKHENRQIMPSSIELQAFYDVSVNDNDIHKKCKTSLFCKEKVDQKYDLTLALTKAYEDINYQMANQEQPNLVSLYVDPYKEMRVKKCHECLKNNWYTWLYQLLNGYNLIFYGVGSKFRIIQEFVNKNLDLETIIVVEGSNSASIPDNLSHRTAVETNFDEEDISPMNSNISDERDTDVIYQLLNQICASYLFPNKKTASKSASQLANEYMHMLCDINDSVPVDVYCKAIIARIESKNLNNVLKSIGEENEKLYETASQSNPCSTDHSYSRQIKSGCDEKNVYNPTTVNKMDFSRYSMMEKHLFNEPVGGLKNKQNIAANTDTSDGSLDTTVNRKIGPNSVYHIPFKHYDHVIRDTKQNLLILLIYNIDGSRLQYKDIQYCLALLAACPYVRIITTFDHLNTAKLENPMAMFKWNWIHLSTYIPTKIEIDQFSLYKLNKRKKKKLSHYATNITNLNNASTSSNNDIFHSQTKNLISIWTGISSIHRDLLIIILTEYINEFHMFMETCKFENIPVLSVESSNFKILKGEEKQKLSKKDLTLYEKQETRRNKENKHIENCIIKRKNQIAAKIHEFSALMKKPEKSLHTSFLFKSCKAKMANVKSQDDLRSKLSELKDQQLISIRDSTVNLLLTHTDVMNCCKLAKIDIGKEYV